MLAYWERLLTKTPKKVIGLNSGTSYDGIDAALVELAGWGRQTRLHLIAYRNYPYSAASRRQLAKLFSPRTGRVDRLCRGNFYLGHLFATAALALIKEAGLTPAAIDLIGSHGQTVYHLPRPVMVEGIPVRATLQLGEPAVIAERTGITTVADFRVRDVAAGGAGAPLLPYVDYLLFGRDEGRCRIIQNIGGIANLTLVGGGLRPEEIIAFDTGPGNMVIDGVVSRLTGGRFRYDRDGQIAAAGQVHAGLLAKLLDHPYFAHKPPKTTGREEFGDDYVTAVLAEGAKYGLSTPDLTATVTALTVETIARHYEAYLFPRYKIDEVIVGGGGASNPTLLAMLAQRVAPVPVRRHEDYGLPSAGKEAVAFAVLANETIHGQPASFPAVTGAAHPVVLGKIIPAFGCGRDRPQEKTTSRQR